METCYNIAIIHWCSAAILTVFILPVSFSSRHTLHLSSFSSRRNLKYRNRRTESHFCYCHPAQTGHGAGRSDNHDIPESPWICCINFIGKIQKVIMRNRDKKSVLTMPVMPGKNNGIWTISVYSLVLYYQSFYISEWK